MAGGLAAQKAFIIQTHRSPIWGRLFPLCWGIFQGFPCPPHPFQWHCSLAALRENYCPFCVSSICFFWVYFLDPTEIATKFVEKMLQIYFRSPRFDLQVCMFRIRMKRFLRDICICSSKMTFLGVSFFSRSWIFYGARCFSFSSMKIIKCWRSAMNL